MLCCIYKLHGLPRATKTRGGRTYEAFNRLAEDACQTVHAIISSPSFVVHEGQQFPRELIETIEVLIKWVGYMTGCYYNLHSDRTLGEVSLLVEEKTSRSWFKPIAKVDLVKVQEYQKRLKSALSLFKVNLVSFLTLTQFVNCTLAAD